MAIKHNGDFKSPNMGNANRGGVRLYSIVYLSIDGQWRSLFPFECMRRSYANGAWGMLKSMIDNSGDVYRLIEINKRTGESDWLEEYSKEKGVQTN